MASLAGHGHSLIVQVLIPTKEQLSKISLMAESRKEVLYEARARADWARHEVRERKRELDALERERGTRLSSSQVRHITDL